MKILNLGELNVLMDTLAHSLRIAGWSGGYDLDTRKRIYDSIVAKMEKVDLELDEDKEKVELKATLDEAIEREYARAENRPMRNGEYPHLVICSGNPKAPLGSPGCVCDNRYKHLVATLREKGHGQDKADSPSKGPGREGSPSGSREDPRDVPP